jgi:predicted nucleotidyltransferase
MESIVKGKLVEIETTHAVKILYACESGSRAWGFASPDSDYDVRFIYVHTKDYYLEIDEQRDVIELPINELLDINGWELRKALRLFRKSNGPIFEWLQSPIIYKADSTFFSEIKNLMLDYFSPRAMMHHYLSMANTVVKTDLTRHELKLKKYFYALRPVLACLWIADRKSIPPMEFKVLRQLLDTGLNAIIDELLERKATVNESFTIKPILELDRWLVERIEYCERHVPDSVTNPPNSLNELFRKYVI